MFPTGLETQFIRFNLEVPASRAGLEFCQLIKLVSAKLFPAPPGDLNFVTDSCGNSLKCEMAACIAVHRHAAINSATHISPTNLFGSLFRLEYINMVNLQINLRLSSRPQAPSDPRREIYQLSSRITFSHAIKANLLAA